MSVCTGDSDIDPLTTLILTPSEEGRMELERGVLVSPTTEVPVVEGQMVTAIRTLAGRGVGKKAIAREVGVAVNTVRRYLRRPIAPGARFDRPRGG